MKAYVFPGQGAQFTGMGKDLYDNSEIAKKMFDTFEGNADGCYLYSRHSTPTNLYLGQALAAMEAVSYTHLTLPTKA